MVSCKILYFYFDDNLIGMLVFYIICIDILTLISSHGQSCWDRTR